MHSVCFTQIRHLRGGERENRFLDFFAAFQMLIGYLRFNGNSGHLATDNLQSFFCVQFSFQIQSFPSCSTSLLAWIFFFTFKSSHFRQWWIGLITYRFCSHSLPKNDETRAKKHISHWKKENFFTTCTVGCLYRFVFGCALDMF